MLSDLGTGMWRQIRMNCALKWKRHDDWARKSIKQGGWHWTELPFTPLRPSRELDPPRVLTKQMKQKWSLASFLSPKTSFSRKEYFGGWSFGLILPCPSLNYFLNADMRIQEFLQEYYSVHNLVHLVIMSWKGPLWKM